MLTDPAAPTLSFSKSEYRAFYNFRSSEIMWETEFCFVMQALKQLEQKIGAKYTEYNSAKPISSIALKS